MMDGEEREEESDEVKTQQRGQNITTNAIKNFNLTAVLYSSELRNNFLSSNTLLKKVYKNKLYYFTVNEKTFFLQLFRQKFGKKSFLSSSETNLGFRKEAKKIKRFLQITSFPTTLKKKTMEYSNSQSICRTNTSNANDIGWSAK